MAQPPRARGGGFVYFARWKTYLNIAILVFGIVFALPNLFTDEQLAPVRAWVPVYKMSLGLDLRGGSHVLLGVDVVSVIQDRLEGIKDEMRDLLRDAHITYEGLDVQGNAVVVKLINPADFDRVREVVAPLVDSDMTLTIDDGNLKLEYTEAGIAARKTHAVEQSIEIVRRRIDAQGVKEPSIQREGSDRIVVQVPGFNDPAELISMIKEAAKMTFHFVDDRYQPSPFKIPDNQVPPGDLQLQEDDPSDPNGGVWYLIEKRVMVSGENLADAAANFRDNQPVVDFSFD